PQTAARYLDEVARHGRRGVGDDYIVYDWPVGPQHFPVVQQYGVHLWRGQFRRHPSFLDLLLGPDIAFRRGVHMAVRAALRATDSAEEIIQIGGGLTRDSRIVNFSQASARFSVLDSCVRTGRGQA